MKKETSKDNEKNKQVILTAWSVICILYMNWIEIYFYSIFSKIINLVRLWNSTLLLFAGSARHRRVEILTKKVSKPLEKVDFPKTSSPCHTLKTVKNSYYPIFTKITYLWFPKIFHMYTEISLNSGHYVHNIPGDIMYMISQGT